MLGIIMAFSSEIPLCILPRVLRMKSLWVINCINYKTLLRRNLSVALKQLYHTQLRLLWWRQVKIHPSLCHHSDHHTNEWCFVGFVFGHEIATQRLHCTSSWFTSLPSPHSSFSAFTSLHHLPVRSLPPLKVSFLVWWYAHLQPRLFLWEKTAFLIRFVLLKIMTSSSIFSNKCQDFIFESFKKIKLQKL